MSWHEGEGKAARIRVPRRRLYQRAVYAWGGWTGKRSGNYAGPNGPVRESRLPPRVLSASGRRPAPTDAAAETKRWTVPTGHQRPPARVSYGK